MKSLPMNNTVKHSVILGTNVSAIHMDMTEAVIYAQLQMKKSAFVCVAAVHLIMEAYRDRKLQQGINTSLLTTPDGMPLVWLSHFMGHHGVMRVYGPDLMERICLLAARNHYGVFLLGGAVGQGKQLTVVLKEKFPSLIVSGYYDTPSRVEAFSKGQELIKRIQATKSDIVFVGLGCPLQEKWMIDNYVKMPGVVCIGVGAAFDFIAGRVQQAPRWMQARGLEWFWRLIHDPRRLWYRYLVLNSAFIIALINDVWKKRDEKTKNTIS